MKHIIPTICISGVAGFIGFHCARRWLREGYRVVGIDNVNAYYEPSLKEARLAILSKEKGFDFHKVDICDGVALSQLVKGIPDLSLFLHLAAQAGVRYSITHPFSYAESNLVGFLHVLEASIAAKVPHLMYASSSSVYGANTTKPSSESQPTDHPISLYAATKKSNELMAHAYSALHALPCTGLRFFTVYGPYGRPDMALFKFTKAILENEPIDLYNHGNMSRDFTYIDDIVEGIYRLYKQGPPKPSASSLTPALSPVAPARIYNIGSQKPVSLTTFVDILEEILGKRAQKRLLSMQPGDIESTYSDAQGLEEATHFSPSMPLRQGVANFASWYCDYYQIKGDHVKLRHNFK